MGIGDVRHGGRTPTDHTPTVAYLRKADHRRSPGWVSCRPKQVMPGSASGPETWSAGTPKASDDRRETDMGRRFVALVAG